MRKQKLLAQKLNFNIAMPKYKYLNNINIEIPESEIKTFFNR